MAQEYVSKPAVFLEEDVDVPVSKDRYERWWAAPGPGGTVYLPLVMIDSGHLVSNGYLDFYNVYKSMIEAEMARPPGAEIECTAVREGDRLRFFGHITNRSGVSLSRSENEASINAIVYEDARVGNTARYVRTAVSSAITNTLADGESVAFALETYNLSSVDWTKLHSIVFADYRPGGSTGAYDMLQAVIPSLSDPSILSFSQVTAGGGWSTAISLTNTGATTANGNLMLIGQDGQPMSITLTDPGIFMLAAGGNAARTTTSGYPLSIPSGATKILTTGPGSPEGPTWSGWAKFESVGGSLSGVGTFQYSHAGRLQTIAGVLGTALAEAATIPIDNNGNENRFTGFAIANPGGDNINITVRTLNEDGTVADTLAPPALNPLGPQHQVALFLHELIPSRSKFKGSVVLTAQDGKKFTAVALIQDRTMFTAIPVIASKVPGLTP